MTRSLFYDTGTVFSMCRKKGPGGLTELDVMNKNPVSLLNELRGSLDYACVSSWGSGTHQLFTMGVTIDGVSYTGTASNKKVLVISVVDPLWFPCGSGSIFFISMRIRIQGAKRMRIRIRILVRF